MVDIFHLYISAAADLEPERESLSRAVADIPVTLGWRVVQSPLHGEPLNENAIVRADLHLLFLGIDIRAPIGLEWHLARRANHLPVTFIKQNIHRTMAAMDFSRYIGEHTTWRVYSNMIDLRQQVHIVLADHLLVRSGFYALKTNEYEKLAAWRKELEAPQKEPPILHGGIGESSVVLSPERYTPSEGVLIQAKPEVGNKKGSIRKKKT